MFINSLKKFKSSKAWYIFLRLLIKPVYDVIWLNLINFHGRILYLLWFFSGNKKIKFDNDKQIFYDEKIEDLSQKIFNNLDENKLNKIIQNLKNCSTKSENLTNTEKKKFKEDITNYIDLDLKKIIFEFCLSKKIISIVSSYLGVMPILNNISVYINIPNDVKDIIGQDVKIVNTSSK